MTRRRWPSSPADTRSAKPMVLPRWPNMSAPNLKAPTPEDMGFGWKNSFGTGRGGDTITSGLEGAWTANPVKWDNNYFENLFGYEWELTKSPAGAFQWKPTNGSGAGT